MIKPKLPSGVLEVPPLKQVTIDRMVQKAIARFTSFGFLPLDTSLLENVELLQAKEDEISKQVYFCSSTGAIAQEKVPDVFLRFEHTFSLARFIAQHERDLTFPFKRYSVGKVFRGERAQKGRFREFYQLDIDILNRESLSTISEAEIIHLMHLVLQDIHIEHEFQINNKNIINGLLEECSIPQNARGSVLSQLDKVEKIGIYQVQENLKEYTWDNIKLFLERLEQGLPEWEKSQNTIVKLGCQQLLELKNTLEISSWKFNPTIVRGLNYYTGNIIETVATREKGLGSICSGGRYDNLVEQFSKRKIPGVGMSLGLTRILSHLLDSKALFSSNTTDILITMEDSNLTQVQTLANNLRKDFNVMVYTEPAKISKQLDYANKQLIPFVIIGDTSQPKITLKNMRLGKCIEIEKESIVKYILGTRDTIKW